MTTDNGRAFNEWLRAQLKAKKMSQRQLAQQSGVDHSTISRLIRGDRMPSLGTATKLARGLREIREDSDTSTALGVVSVGPQNPTARVVSTLAAASMAALLVVSTGMANANGATASPSTATKLTSSAKVSPNAAPVDITVPCGDSDANLLVGGFEIDGDLCVNHSGEDWDNAPFATERYANGAGTQLDLVQAQRDAFAAEVGRVQADADLTYARALLRLTSGVPLDKDQR